jgi:hypothetical protein
VENVFENPEQLAEQVEELKRIFPLFHYSTISSTSLDDLSGALIDCEPRKKEDPKTEKKTEQTSTVEEIESLEAVDAR